MATVKVTLSNAEGLVLDQILVNSNDHVDETDLAHDLVNYIQDEFETEDI